VTDHPKMVRIGVRVPARSAKAGVMPGYQAAVYDVDTGDVLPAESIDLHMKAGEVVSATLTLFPYEVTVGDPPAEASSD
jgi:hypothetical protein